MIAPTSLKYFSAPGWNGTEIPETAYSRSSSSPFACVEAISSFVIENSLCEVINCFFGKLRGCDQSSFDSNCLNIIVNALIGAARDCVCCVERMCIRKLLRMLVIDLKKVDRICCSELYDRCCRCACCTEESIDLAVFNASAESPNPRLLTWISSKEMS